MIQMNYKYRLNMHMDESSSWDGVKDMAFRLGEPKDKHLQSINGGWSPQNSISFNNSALSRSFSANKDLRRLLFFMREPIKKHSRGQSM